MNPNDIQQFQNSYQQAVDVAVHFKFLVYSSYTALLICAVFSIFIFWKLCQIKQLLKPAEANPFSPADQTSLQQIRERRDAQRLATAPISPVGGDGKITGDDSRFMPKA